MKVAYFAEVKFEAHKIMSILLRTISLLGTLLLQKYNMKLQIVGNIMEQ